jgi:hypothetical protein
MNIREFVMNQEPRRRAEELFHAALERALEALISEAFVPGH